MRLNVSSTMRIDSVEPLMEGAPLHKLAEDMVLELVAQGSRPFSRH